MIRRRALAAGVVMALVESTASMLLFSGCAFASSASPEFEFDPSFGGTPAERVDISRFGRGDRVAPGEYPLDTYINSQHRGRELIRFKEGDVPAIIEGAVQPCLSTALLRRLGAIMPEAAPDVECYDIAALSTEASVHLDMQLLRMDISIPQAYTRNVARGDIDPMLWDEGITAGLLNYDLNGFSVSSAGQHQRQGSLALQAGVNVAGWRLRHDGIMQWSNGGGRTWQNTRAILQRDITRWRSQLTLGDGFTAGTLYDSVGYRGINLSTDSRMFPDSMGGYAPVVRGSADSNARVEIRQNGFLIHTLNVPPGPFAISDLGASGYGGDLNVNVIETDGRVRSFTVPFSAVPQLLRPGAARYSATLGQLRRYDEVDAPYFFEGTYQRGINNTLTLYGGMQLGEQGFYRSFLLGGAFNTAAGAFSLGVTRSQSERGVAGTSSGNSLRLAYSKNMANIGTNFSLATYRYSSDGFMDIGEAGRSRYGNRGNWRGNALWGGHDAPRNRLDLIVNQRLGDRGGSLSVTGSRHEYWRSRSNTSYQVGYSNNINAFAYSLNANRTRLADGRNDTQFALNINVPLGRSGASGRTRLMVEASDRESGSSGRVGISGNAGAQGTVSYGANLARNEEGRTSAMLNGNYQASVASFNVAYGKSGGARQISGGVSGGMVAHQGGLTFSQSLAETIGVVQAPGAKGARIGGGRSEVDRRGYGVITSLTPYRYNEIALDPKNTSLDVELDGTLARVVPRAGAVVVLSYATRMGRPVLLRARLDNDTSLPFGAQVLDVDGNELGSVGQGGQIFLRNLEPAGILNVRWGDSASQSCSVPYAIPPSPQPNISFLNVTCHIGNATAQHVAGVGDIAITAQRLSGEAQP